MSVQEELMEELEQLSVEAQREVLALARSLRQQQSDPAPTDSPDGEQVDREASLGHS